MEDYNPYEEELQLTKKFFKEGRWSVDKIIEFTREHRVDILRGADFNVLAYIDYEEGKSCAYGLGLTPLWSLCYGIECYEKKHRKENS